MYSNLKSLWGVGAPPTPLCWRAVRPGCRLNLLAPALALMIPATCSCGHAAAEPPLTVLISSQGRIALSRGRKPLGEVTPGLFEKQWRSAGLAGPVGKEPVSRELRLGRIKAPGGAIVACELRPEVLLDGVLLKYRLVPQAEVYLNSLHVSGDFAEATAVGGTFVADGQSGAFSKERAQTHLRSGPMKDLRLHFPEGGEVRLDFESPTPVLVQDNRQWGPSFSVRVGPQSDASQAWPAGKALEIAFKLTASGGVKVEFDEPVTIEASDEWVPLKLELDIEPGSALDFSSFGQFDAPAGKHGWVIAGPDGHLAFEKDPKTPRRFYGVNLCFSAHYISHEQSDRLAERLMRLGYNTVRFHHYEGELVDRSSGTSTTLNKEKLDQLDYLFAALKKRGLYVTTDLFVSRPVLAGEVFAGGSGDLGMDNFKMLVPVNARAMENWKAFARNLLTHVNPYTGLRYADDPALAWLSMINEGNFGNYTGGLSARTRGEWDRAWGEWLQQRYGNSGAKPWGAQPDFTIFLAETDRKMCREMRQFLREEIGTKALLTNMNGWSNPIQNQVSRQDYDYVDDHFYVDHPHFLEQPWRLPSRCENSSPVAAGAPGGRHCAFTRLLDKPFTISEYNYSGPGRFRGVGGILTGCMGALQDWSVIWRFAYSHNRENLFRPGAAGYFDVATDPLNQAAERASLCLFLRGDMQPAKHTLGIAMTEADLVGPSPRQANLAPPWHALALVARVGTLMGAKPRPADLVLPVSKNAAGLMALPADPYSSEAGAQIVDELRKRRWLAPANVTDLTASRLHSETGELLVDAPRDVLVLNTPRTAGCYAPAGETVKAGPVTVTIRDTDATVWVSSLDGKAIAESQRLLLTHLTDLQNTGARFGERARQTLLAWGTLPHLVRNGGATVSVARKRAAAVEVFALATSGKRLGKVEAEWKSGVLTVPLKVAGPEGARIMYEVVVQP